MNHSTVPFISIISTFSNTGMYNKEIREDLLQLVPAIEEYIEIKLTSNQLVCKSFISHLTRLLERIYNHQLIQGEQQGMESKVRMAFLKHQKHLQTIFQNLFPDKNVELTSIEMYFLVLYILHLKEEFS